MLPILGDEDLGGAWKPIELSIRCYNRYIISFHSLSAAIQFIWHAVCIEVTSCQESVTSGSVIEPTLFQMELAQL